MLATANELRIKPSRCVLRAAVAFQSLGWRIAGDLAAVFEQHPRVAEVGRQRSVACASRCTVSFVWTRREFAAKCRVQWIFRRPSRKTLRTSKISRILWTDFECEDGRQLVRDMKNPGDKIGNDVICDAPRKQSRS
jgi:hypothetical protein